MEKSVDTYTHENYSPSVLPAKYSKDIKELVANAVDLGWTLHVANDAGIYIMSHDGLKKRHFNPSKKSGPITRMKREVIKHADPARVAAINERLDQREVEQFEAKKKAARAVRPTPPKVTPRDVQQLAEKFNGPEHPVVEPTAPEPERWIVSERPHLSHRSAARGTKPGKVYESHAILQREWSDGTVDYRCRVCEFSSAKPLSIRGHWALHVRAGEAPKFDPAKVVELDDPSYVAPVGPRRTRSSTPVESSDADVLAQIRALVGGADPQALTAAEERIRELEERIRELEAALEATRLRADRLAEKWRVFSELAQEELGDAS